MIYLILQSTFVIQCSDALIQPCGTSMELGSLMKFANGYVVLMNLPVQRRTRRTRGLDDSDFRKTKDEFGALASFLMLNLVKEAYGPERRVPGELLAQGATRFWRGVMPIVRPKLVVALTRGVYGVLLSAARGQGLRVDELPETRVESGNKVYQLPKARIRSGGRGNVLVVTVLTHPSWLRSWIDQRKIQNRLRLTAYLGACVEEALRV